MKSLFILVIGVCLISMPRPAASAPPKGPIDARIVQIIPNGDSTLLVLDRGKRVGVAVGATGTVKGTTISITITEASGFRSKAIAKVKASALRSSRSVSIEQKEEAPAKKKAKLGRQAPGSRS